MQVAEHYDDELVALHLYVVPALAATRSTPPSPNERSPVFVGANADASVADAHASSTVRAIVLFGARERVYKEKL